VHLTDRHLCADVLPHSQPCPCRDPGSSIDPGSRGGLSSDARRYDPLGSSALRAQGDLLNRIKLMLPVQSPLAKIFPFPFYPNHFYLSRHPGPHKGAFRDRHERRAGMRWTRAALLTRALFLRTAKSCGPDAPTLASSSWEAKASWGRWWQTSPVTRESAK
jgi:hypothetical protein